MNIHGIVIRISFVCVSLWGLTASSCFDISHPQATLFSQRGRSGDGACISVSNCLNKADETGALAVRNDH